MVDLAGGGGAILVLVYADEVVGEGGSGSVGSVPVENEVALRDVGEAIVSCGRCSRLVRWREQAEAYAPRSVNANAIPATASGSNVHQPIHGPQITSATASTPNEPARSA